jgi:cytochrome c5
MKSLVLAVLLTFVLTACGSPAPTVPPTSVPPAALPSQPTQAPSSATALPVETPALDGATLLETRCSVCHSADRPKQAKKTREQWDQTVARMIGKGAQLTEAEKTVLLDYLAKTYGP